MSGSTSLVTTEWLFNNLDNPNVRIFDSSWHMPALGRDPEAEFAASHIPGALLFNIDEISDLDMPLPHMMPSAEKMASRLRQFGVSNTDHIVFYDNSMGNSSTRGWYMLKSFGHDKVSVLNGGQSKWSEEGRPMTTDLPILVNSHYRAERDENATRTVEQVINNISSGHEQIIDARSKGRFYGTEPEPRKELKSGHIPGSFNVPFTALINEDKTFKTPDKLRAIFEDSGVDLNKPIVTSCGSGMTACVLLFALHLIGQNNYALYDGSWTDWGSHPDTPVDKLI